MPLSCDCYPGCWGDHSKGWPLVPFKGAPKSDTRVVVRSVIPHGSYVEVDDGIRIEPDYADKLPNQLRDFLKVKNADAADDEGRNVTAYERAMEEHRDAQEKLISYSRRQCEATESIARSLRTLLHDKDRREVKTNG